MKKIAIGLVVVFSLGALVTLFADASEVWGTLGEFHWQLAPLLLLLTIVSFGARYVRWHLLLDVVSDQALRNHRRETGLSFLAGLSGLLTPLKAGELSRAYFLDRLIGIPLARSLPVILSERLLDGAAMILLSCVALLIYLEILLYREVLGSVIVFVAGAGVVFLVIAAVVWALRQASLVSGAARHIGKLLKIDEESAKDPEFIDANRRIFSFDTILISTGLGVVYWGAQALVFFVVVVSFDEALSFETLIRALFVYPMAILVGTITMIPFGIGPTDASLVFLGNIMFDLSRSELMSAAIISRIFILLPPVIVGIAAAASKPIRENLGAESS